MRISALIAIAIAGCAPEAPPPVGQLVLHVDTDAPLPPAPGEPEDSIALFDTMRVDVLVDGRPLEGLSRELAIDQGVFRSGRGSVGIVAPAGRTNVSVRVRIFRYVRQAANEPAPRTTIDTTMTLPPVHEGSVDHVALTMHTTDVGRLVGYPEPIASSTYDPAVPPLGTWPYARRVGCTGAPRDGEVCVPDGVYWFGSAGAHDPSDALDFGAERLVVVAPFFVDATEVTVAAVGAASPAISATRSGPSCTTLGALPANCLSFRDARAVCTARGMDLPTEAQWEWMASGSGADTDWPWGDAPPQCSDASFGTSEECPGNTVKIPRSYPRDRVLGAIFDLAGNLSEWTRDAALESSDPPWNSLGVLMNPIGAGTALVDHVARGGAPGISLASTRVSTRRAPGDSNMATGFRCVR